MEAFKYEYSATDQAKLINIQRKAREIAAKEGISIQEATKKATLIALNRKRTTSGKGGKRNKPKSGGKKGGKKISLLDKVLGRK